MANYFSEKRYYCPKCNGTLFKEEKTFILNEGKDNKLKKDPYKTIVVCCNCNVEIDRELE